MERGVIRADPVVLLKCSSKSFAVVPIESSNCRILRQSSAVIMPIMAAATTTTTIVLLYTLRTYLVCTWIHKPRTSRVNSRNFTPRKIIFKMCKISWKEIWKCKWFKRSFLTFHPKILKSWGKEKYVVYQTKFWAVWLPVTSSFIWLYVWMNVSEERFEVVNLTLLLIMIRIEGFFSRK